MVLINEMGISKHPSLIVMGIDYDEYINSGILILNMWEQTKEAT